MLDAFVEFEIIGESNDFAIDPGPHVAALQHVGEEVFELALLPAHDRREQQEPRPFGKCQNAPENLLAGLGGDRPFARWAISLPEACIQHTQVIADLRDGADSRTRIATGGLLLDADRGGQSTDEVDVGFR